jgi:2-oxoglutarate dehydrogenase E2 component (dihydrolipoamide succinyltransferase)
MIEIKVPILPESINDATVAVWHKKPGDSVVLDEVIVEVETDKVVLEVPATEPGVLTEILAQEGETVNEQQVLGLMNDKTGDISAANNSPEDDTDKASVEETEESTEKAAMEEPEGVSEEPGVEPKPEADTEPSAEETQQVDNQESLSEHPQLASQSNRMEERVAMSRIRKTIANRLHSATQSTAMLTTFNEIDMSAILDMRSNYKEAFENKYSIKLGFMSFFVKAAVEALKKFPTVNAYIDGDEIVYHAYCDVSVAVSTDRGLVVPVLRDAHKMAMHDIEKDILDFAARAQEGTLNIEEMSGGTFTVSNGGVFGSLLSTPILNSPQSAILGMHKTQERAVVVDGEVVVRPMMYLALSYDHRIIDGKEAVQFLIAIKDALEDPARLLLKI